MTASRLLWLVLVPLLLANSVLWAAYTEQPVVSAIWLGLAIGGKKLFLNDNWNHR